MKKIDILSVVITIAGLSTLFGNAEFAALLAKVMPAAIAQQIVAWGSILAIVAGWIVARITPTAAAK